MIDGTTAGQFGIGACYSDKVSGTSKCDDDAVQHVGESSADASFTNVDDPRGSTLDRGTL